MLIECPRLTPIQARLAVSLITLTVLFIIYWTLTFPKFAYAAELDYSENVETREGSDHNWHRKEAEEEEERIEIELDSKQEHNTTIARRQIVARDTLLIDANNSPNNGSLSAGESDVWRYTMQLLLQSAANQTAALPSNFTDAKRWLDDKHHDLRKRDEDHPLVKKEGSVKPLYISINTCAQPIWSGSDLQTDGPPQLSLYTAAVSDFSDVEGPYELEEGFTRLELMAGSDIFVKVSAPALSSDFYGSWSYQLALSTDDYYHGSNSSVPFLYLVDTDINAALLVTDNLTQSNSSATDYKEWMSLSYPLPFEVFASASDDTRRLGLSQSVCGLQNISQIPSKTNGTNGNDSFVSTSMITRGLGSKPKQQFFIGNLANGTIYNATLALIGNGVEMGKGIVGGGGTVWQSTFWKTKSDGNCQLLFDLDFCDEVAYAVPSNPQFNISTLASLYDDYAAELYKPFNWSLAQVQCNTSNDQRYSLARDCDDCASAYKYWLCAVTLPRCEDFSNQAGFLQIRNVGQAFLNGSMLSDDVLNSPYVPMDGAPTLEGSPRMQSLAWSFSSNQSRNPTLIDNTIKPGPYKEILPCNDICWNLMQSCPASMQFQCPYPGRGLEVDYAPRPTSQSIVSCNYFGAVYYIDDARQIIPSMTAVLSLAILVTLVFSL